MSNHNHLGATILSDLFDAFNIGSDKVLSLFHPHAIVEYPYAAAMNMPSEMNMATYREHLDAILGRMPNIEFTHLRCYALEQPGKFWAEVHGSTKVTDKSLIYEQDYVIYFELQDNKFICYREYWNVLPILKTLFPKEVSREILNN